MQGKPRGPLHPSLTTGLRQVTDYEHDVSQMLVSHCLGILAWGNTGLRGSSKTTRIHVHLATRSMLLLLLLTSCRRVRTCDHVRILDSVVAR